MNHRIQQLRLCLRKEFYVNSLYEMAALCRAIALDSPHPAAFFVSEQIFKELAREWDEQPLPVEVAQGTKQRLAGPFEELIDAVEAGASTQHLAALTDRIVGTYLHLKG